MSIVRTFSQTFPSYHPRAGEQTDFVHKIWKGLYPDDPDEALYNHECSAIWSVYKEIYQDIIPKWHTIRAGYHFKVGDWFSPRVWSGKPYNSKQIIIAPDIQVKKVWDFIFVQQDELLVIGEVNYYPLGYTNAIEHLSKNDGLLFDDFKAWFNKPFEGQIICWNDSINY